MQASWIAGLALAGCGFEHGAIRVDSDQPDVPSDQDGDGVLNAMDNCPLMANGEQQDHDGDMRGDVCDGCPHLPSPTELDGDADQVGDECDPRPQSAGDRRMLWEPFDAAGSIATWTTAGTMGTWSVANGALRQTMLGADTVLRTPSTFQRPYVATELIVDSLGAVPWIGFRSGAIGFTQNYACLMEFGPNLLATSFAMGTQNDNQRSIWTGSFTTGASVTLVQNHTSGNACKASQSPATAAMTTTPVAGSASGAVELYTRDSAARFNYLFVVEIGP